MNWNIKRRSTRKAISTGSSEPLCCPSETSTIAERLDASSSDSLQRLPDIRSQSRRCQFRHVLFDQLLSRRFFLDRLIGHVIFCSCLYAGFDNCRDHRYRCGAIRKVNHLQGALVTYLFQPLGILDGAIEQGCPTHGSVGNIRRLQTRLIPRAVSHDQGRGNCHHVRTTVTNHEPCQCSV